MRLVRRCGALVPEAEEDEGPDRVEIEDRRCSAGARRVNDLRLVVRPKRGRRTLMHRRLNVEDLEEHVEKRVLQRKGVSQRLSGRGGRGERATHPDDLRRVGERVDERRERLAAVDIEVEEAYATLCQLMVMREGERGRRRRTHRSSSEEKWRPSPRSS